MKDVTRAEEVLQKGETAVVIFTRGHDTKIMGDGTGYTGYWVMNLERHQFDKVVLYWREGKENKVYVADFDGVIEEQNGRYKLALSNIKRKATASSTWWGFINCRSSNPIRYIEASYE